MTNTTIVIEISTPEGFTIAEDKKPWLLELMDGVVSQYLSKILAERFKIANTAKVYYKN